MDKTITVTIDSDLLDAIALEIKQHRNLNAAKSLTDVFMIRFLTAAENNTKILSLHRKKNKMTVREFDAPPVVDPNGPKFPNEQQEVS
jgi:hypothetical protein